MTLVLASSVMLYTGSPALALQVQDAQYDCTIIASSLEFPDAFSRIPPTVNSQGRVAFFANLATGSGIYTGIGDTDASGDIIIDPVVTAAHVGAFLTNLGTQPPVIVDDGRVYFKGTKTPGGGGGAADGIFRKYWYTDEAIDPEWRLETTNWDAGAPFIRINDAVMANTRDDVAFIGRDIVESQDGLFWEAGSSPNPLVYFQNPGDDVGTVRDFDIHPSDQPWYGYISNRYNSSDTELNVLQMGEPYRVLNGAVASMDGVSIAGSALPVASWAESVYDGGATTWRIHQANAIAMSVYVDNGVDTTGFSGAPSQTSINGYAEVAFSGGWEDEMHVADGDVLNRVVCNNAQSVFGTSYFAKTIHSKRAINNDGQIAFITEASFYMFPGQSVPAWYVVLADPVTRARPTSCISLLDDSPCDDGVPETVSLCAGEICTPVPEPKALRQGVVALLALALVGGSRKNRPRFPHHRY